MAEVETITISAVNYEVYGLGNADPVNDADEYFAAVFGETWSALTTLQKQQALVSARRLLDRAVLWSGSKSVASQGTEHPRDGMVNGCTGESVTDGEIPDEIAYGEFELAALIAADAGLLNSPGTGTNTKRVKAGSAEVEFFSPTIGTGEETRLPQAVHDLVGCYVSGSGGLTPTGGSFASGTGDSSSFDDCDDNELSRGYP